MDDDKWFREHALDDVWLHSVHFACKSDAEPLVPLWACNRPGTTKQPWDQKLKGIALFALQKAGLQGDTCDDELVLMPRTAGTVCQMVQLLNTELQVVIDHECEGTALLQVPLSFSDVVWTALPAWDNCNAEPKFMVVLSPRPDVEDEGSLGTAFLRKVWVLCVGGSYTHEGLQELLISFSSRGAVRWDFDQCYRMSEKSLAEGGCGEVFLGQSITQVGAAKVAVKLMKTTLKLENQEKAIRSEISILAEVRGHPNISILVGVFCYFDEEKNEASRTSSLESLSSSASDGNSVASSEASSLEEAAPAGEQLRWAIALELCPHGDLFDFLSSNRALEQAAILEIALSVLSALSHIHAHEVVHRDVKAENILIAEGFRPVLADFGIAAHLHDRKSMAKRVGSPGYLAPEVLGGKRYGSKVDMFSAGAMLYFATCDVMPFPGSDKDEVLARTLRCKVRFPSRVLSGHSSSLLALIKRLLSKTPIQRPSANLAFRAAWSMASEDTRNAPTVLAAAEAMERLEHIAAQPEAVPKHRLAEHLLKLDAKHKAECSPQQQAAEMPECDCINDPRRSCSMPTSATSNAQVPISSPTPLEARNQLWLDSAEQNALLESRPQVQGTAVGKSVSFKSTPRVEPDSAKQNVLPENRSQLQGTEASKSTSFGSPPRGSSSLPSVGALSAEECQDVPGTGAASHTGSGSRRSPEECALSTSRAPSTAMSPFTVLPVLPASAAPRAPPQLPMPLIQDAALQEPPDKDVPRAERLGGHESESEGEPEPFPQKMLVPRPPDSAARRLSSRVSRVGRRFLRPIERVLKMTNGDSSHSAKQPEKSNSSMGEAGGEPKAPDQAPTLLNGRRGRTKP